MLSLKSFEKLSKQEAYNIYEELYKKVEEKDAVIVDFIKDLKSKWNQSPAPQQTKENTVGYSTRVREFQTIKVKDEATNIILGSSIIKRMATDRTIPDDVQVLAYPGSSTKEKIRIVEKYEEKKIKTMVLQDGTNAILKQSNSPVEELMSDFSDLVDIVQQKFMPEHLLLLEVIPVKDTPSNRGKNDRINAFNENLREFNNDP